MKYKSLLKRIIVALVIILSAFGIWKALTSPNFNQFLVNLKKVLTRTNLFLFCLAICIYLLSIPLSVLSWNAVLKMFDSAVSVFQLIPILMAGVFVNNTTPMSRAGGEIIRVYGLCEKSKLPYTVAILSVALSKLIEIIPIGLMSIISISVLVQKQIISWQQLRFMGMIGCLIVVIVVWFIYKRHYISTLWSKLLHYLIRQEKKFNGKQFTAKQISRSIKTKKKAFGESLLFSSLLWTLAVVRLKVLAYALGIEFPFSVAAAVTVWYVMVGFLAFTPGGIGIIESGLVGSLVLMGIAPSQAFALTVLERAISYVLSTGIGAFCLFALGGKQLLKGAGESIKN